MANSRVTMQVLLSFLDPDSGVTPPDALSVGPSSFEGVEHQYTKNLMTVPTTAGGIAIPLGAVTSPGDFAAVNQDSTNFITIYDAVSGNPIAQLDAGKMCLIPLDPGITAPAVKADTAACQMRYFIVERGDISPTP
jgi:hypothetical protein